MFLDATDQMKFAAALQRATLSATSSVAAATSATMAKSCEAVVDAYGDGKARKKATRKTKTSRSTASKKTSSRTRKTKQSASAGPLSMWVDLAFAPMKFTLDAAAPKPKPRAKASPVWMQPAWMSAFPADQSPFAFAAPFASSKKQAWPFEPQMFFPDIFNSSSPWDNKNWASQWPMQGPEAWMSMCGLGKARSSQPKTILDFVPKAPATPVTQMMDNVVEFTKSPVGQAPWTKNAAASMFQPEKIAAGMAAFAAMAPVIQQMSSAGQWPFFSA